MFVGCWCDVIGELQGEGGFVGVVVYCVIEGVYWYVVEDYCGVGEVVDCDLVGLVGYFVVECDSVCCYCGF